MPIPQFSFEVRVSQRGARHDKIEIGIENGLLSGDPVDVGRFLERLGSPPIDERNGTEASAYGRFFTRPRRIEPPFQKQPIRSRPISIEGNECPPPLFEGALYVKSPRTDIWRLDARLSVNPTRIFRHHPTPASPVVLNPEFTTNPRRE